MSKKLTSLFFSLVLVFSMASSAFADAEAKTLDESTIAAKTISIYDVVPQDYFVAVKGKYHSKEEVQNATGFKSVKSNITSMNFDNSFDNGAIIVNNLDELAALLSYYADLEKQVNNSLLSVSPAAATGDYITTYEKTIWGDGLAGGANLSWITGSVKLKKQDNTHKIISVLDTDSTLHGFHPGNSWKHSAAKTTYGIASDRYTGWATIVGDRTLSIIKDGIGDIFTKQESYNMSF